jgi:hypothetical protein
MCTLTVVSYEYILYTNSYIQSNFVTKEALDFELVAAADDTVATDAAYSVSGVSILDDAEGNIKAVLGDEKFDEEEAVATAASDDAEGNIKAVSEDKKSDVVESSAPAAASVVVAVASTKSAASVASTAVAAPDILSVQKKGVSGLLFYFA